jgi:hypothetical protein
MKDYTVYLEHVTYASTFGQAFQYMLHHWMMHGKLHIVIAVTGSVS